jgi:hypothetical protein
MAAAPHGLPIWWAEWYSTFYPQPVPWEHGYQNVVMTTALLHMIRSGAAVALRWAPQGVANQPYEGDSESIWSDTSVPSCRIASRYFFQNVRCRMRHPDLRQSQFSPIRR